MSAIDHSMSIKSIKSTLNATQLGLLMHMLFSCSGFSKGLAFVQFTHPQDAQRALEQYNGVALDGKPMKIEFESNTNRKLSSGIRYFGTDFVLINMSLSVADL